MVGSAVQLALAGLALGAWLSNTWGRREKLSAEQVEQLEALGVAW
ncbi:hypothetical protein [Kitasatospora acidiphila]|nr:hypothetical protein [Kitasatospora acidiphila]